MHFVFFHVGEDTRPELLVQSIRRVMPLARITQASDTHTKHVEGVSEVVRFVGDASRLMTFRLLAFSGLGLTSPAIYMDTDMLLLRPIDTGAMLRDADVAVCRRTFHRDAPINTKFRGGLMLEYQGMTLDEVYPILACFTATVSFHFWRECVDALMKLPDKFHTWYGDQEAMKRVVRSGLFEFREVEESKVACLPEKLAANAQPWAVHFKGPRRKELMFAMASRLAASTSTGKD